MPCKPAKAKHLLKAGKAKVFKLKPFTIQLLWDCEANVQDVTCGIDKGAKWYRLYRKWQCISQRHIALILMLYYIIMKQRISYPRTTVSQRKRLFQVWEETGNLKEALREARVSERTFYYWKPRFEQGGYQALEDFASHAPKNPKRTDRIVEQRVIQLRQNHPKWGKRRLADELAKENNWIALVSPNTVKRILVDTGIIAE